MSHQSGLSRWTFLLAFTLVTLETTRARGDDWPQWLGSQRDGIWRETGLVNRFPKGGPKVLWRIPLHTGYSGPAVVEGRVYVMDRKRTTDKAGKPLRPTRKGILGNERVLCLDAGTGKQIWERVIDCPYTISYGSGPRVTPLVHGRRVYTLGGMGDLFCLDAASGKPVWTKNLPREYKTDPPVWGYAGHPLIDGNLLYCLAGGPGSAVVALHKDTGKEVWKALTTQEIGYSPPMIYTVGGKRQLIIWLSESVNGLDPATGKVFWTRKYPADRNPQRPAVNIATVRCAGDLLFVSTYYHGPMMLQFTAGKSAPDVLWRGKSHNPGKPDGLHSTMATPVVQDGYIYGICAAGELRCLEAKTGKPRWSTLAVMGGKRCDCGTAFLIPQAKRFVLFNDQGELILADLTPKGYKEIDRARILEPVQEARGRTVVWSHPAFARRCVFARNDKEIVCVSLAKS
jgi:outer membrane protein assembly factor BamB